MNKNIIKILILLIFIPLLVFAQDYFFNPFQFGIKTSREIREITDSTFIDKVRAKAAELLNRIYNTSTLFAVSGGTIVSNDPQISVNQAVRENYGNWNILLTQAADEVIKTDQAERNRLAQHLQISPDAVLDLAVLNVKIENNRLVSIYVGPSSQQGGIPRVNYCEQGIGQCALWLLTYILRFFYTLTLFLGVIFLIWAGILYITNPTNASQIHSRFYYGLLGVVVGVLAMSFVVALERGLSGGTFVAVNQQNQGQQNQGQQNQQQQQRGGRINIDPSSITYADNNINFIASSNNNCSLNVLVFNLRSGQTLPSRNNIQVNTTPNMIQINVLNVRPGDTLRLYFSSDNCNVNLSQYDLRTPSTRVEVVLQSIDVEIYGVQTFRINRNIITTNFFRALQNFFSSSNWLTNIADYFLFDPPFYIRFSYDLQNPPTNNGTCRLTLSIKAANATNINLDQNGEVIGLDWRRFTKTFSFNLPYEANESQNIVQLPINLPQNTFIQIEYSILNISNCSTTLRLAEPEIIRINF